MKTCLYFIFLLSLMAIHLVSLSEIVAAPADTTIKIRATETEICAGETVTLSVKRPCVVGDILCADGDIVTREDFPKSGKTARGVVFWVSPDETHGWAVHLQEVENIEWSTEKVDIPDLPNIDFDTGEKNVDTAGYRNTRIIREYAEKNGKTAAYPAVFAVDCEHEWYLPASGQTLFLQAEIPELNRSLAVIPGAMLMGNIESGGKNDWDCWSSSEIDHEWVIVGNNLKCRSFAKSLLGHFHTRGVCSFKIRL